MKSNRDDNLKREREDRNKRRTKDLGDPRGSRQPWEDTKKSKLKEKGDINRPYKK